jgi:hypothetical protein
MLKRFRIQGIPADLFSVVNRRASLCLYFFNILQNSIISAFSLSNNLTFIEINPDFDEDCHILLVQKKIEYSICNHIDSVCSLFAPVTTWHCYTTAFGYVSVIPYIQRPCEILDISAEGKALVAILPDAFESTTTELKSQVYNFEISYGSSPMTLECQTKNGTISYGCYHLVETQIEFIYLMSPVPTQIVGEFLASLPLQKEISMFSFMDPNLIEAEWRVGYSHKNASVAKKNISIDCFQEPEKSLLKDLHAEKQANIRSLTYHPEENADDEELDESMEAPSPRTDALKKISSSGTTPFVWEPAKQTATEKTTVEDDTWLKYGSSGKEEFQTAEEFPITPKGPLTDDDPPESSSSHKEKIKSESDTDESHEQKEANGSKPILNSPKKHVARFDEKEWPKVAEILKNAKNDKPKHWKHYSQLIDGGNGHGRSTLIYWYEQLQKNPDWKPTREACGKKNQILSPQAENHVSARLREMLSRSFQLHCNPKPNLRGLRTGCNVFARNIWCH